MLILLFQFAENSSKKEFLEVTLKRLLFNQLLMSKSYSKALFLFYFSLFRCFSNQAFPLSLQTVYYFFTVFPKQKTVPPNGHFSNGKQYQASQQPLVSQIYIQVTLYNLLL